MAMWNTSPKADKPMPAQRTTLTPQVKTSGPSSPVSPGYSRVKPPVSTPASTSDTVQGNTLSSPVYHAESEEKKISVMERLKQFKDTDNQNATGNNVCGSLPHNVLPVKPKPLRKPDGARTSGDVKCASKSGQVGFSVKSGHTVRGMIRKHSKKRPTPAVRRSLECAPTQQEALLTQGHSTKPPKVKPKPLVKPKPKLSSTKTDTQEDSPPSESTCGSLLSPGDALCSPGVSPTLKQRMEALQFGMHGTQTPKTSPLPSPKPRPAAKNSTSTYGAWTSPKLTASTQGISPKQGPCISPKPALRSPVKDTSYTYAPSTSIVQQGGTSQSSCTPPEQNKGDVHVSSTSPVQCTSNVQDGGSPHESCTDTVRHVCAVQDPHISQVQHASVVHQADTSHLGYKETEEGVSHEGLQEDDKDWRTDSDNEGSKPATPGKMVKRPIAQHKRRSQEGLKRESRKSQKKRTPRSGINNAHRLALEPRDTDSADYDDVAILLQLNHPGVMDHSPVMECGACSPKTGRRDGSRSPRLPPRGSRSPGSRSPHLPPRQRINTDKLSVDVPSHGGSSPDMYNVNSFDNVNYIGASCTPSTLPIIGSPRMALRSRCQDASTLPAAYSVMLTPPASRKDLPTPPASRKDKPKPPAKSIIPPSKAPRTFSKPQLIPSPSDIHPEEPSSDRHMPPHSDLAGDALATHGTPPVKSPVPPVAPPGLFPKPPSFTAPSLPTLTPRAPPGEESDEDYVPPDSLTSDFSGDVLDAIDRLNLQEHNPSQSEENSPKLFKPNPALPPRGMTSHVEVNRSQRRKTKRKISKRVLDSEVYLSDPYSTESDVDSGEVIFRSSPRSSPRGSPSPRGSALTDSVRSSPRCSPRTSPSPRGSPLTVLGHVQRKTSLPTQTSAPHRKPDLPPRKGSIPEYKNRPRPQLPGDGATDNCMSPPPALPSKLPPPLRSSESFRKQRREIPPIPDVTAGEDDYLYMGSEASTTSSLSSGYMDATKINAPPSRLDDTERSSGNYITLMDREVNLDRSVPSSRDNSDYFDDEPLYQIYHSNAIQRDVMCQHDDYDPYDYEDVGTVSQYVEEILQKRMSTISRTSTCSSASSDMSTGSANLRDLIQTHKGTRTMWCQMERSQKFLDIMSDKEKRLQESLFEIVTSEASYLKSLNLLISHFMEHPAFNLRCPQQCLLKKREHTRLFSNILEVRLVSHRFMGKLEQLWDANPVLQPKEMSTVLLEACEKEFDAYISYMGNTEFQTRILKTLNKENQIFRAVLDELEAFPACQGLRLWSFLILPMQRMTRLPLLASAVCQLMSPAGDIYDMMVRSSQAVSQIVKQGNQKARQLNNIEQVAEIASKLLFKNNMKSVPVVSERRSLVKKGSLVHVMETSSTGFLHKLKKKDPVWLFLFNDLLFLTKKKSDGQFQVIEWSERIYSHGEIIPDEEVRKLIPGGTMRELVKMPYLFNVILLNKNKKFTFACNSLSERTRWVEAMIPVQHTSEGESIYEMWDCPQVQVIQKYTAKERDELSLAEGEVVNVLRKMNDGWYEGERIRDGEKGWFPSDYTMEIQSSHVRARNLRQQYMLMGLQETNVSEV